MGQNHLLKLSGFFMGGVIILMIFANHWMSKEMTTVTQKVPPPVQAVAPTSAIEEKNAPQTPKRDRRAEIQDLQEVLEAKETPKSEPKKIIYEKPLDDVILVQ